MLVSCFRLAYGILREDFVSLSDSLWAPELIWLYGFLLCIQLCCCLLFIVHEYWRNSTSYIASCHPLNVPLPRVLVSQTIPNATGYTVCYLYFLYPSETGRWFHFAISCPSIKCIWLRNLDRTHRFAVYALIGVTLSICFSGTVGTQLLYHTSKMVMFLQYNRRTLF